MAGGSSAELMKMIDSPQRPLRISFRDPEFDTAEAKAAAEQRRAEQDAAKTVVKTDAVLSEGMVLSSVEEFGATISNPVRTSSHVCTHYWSNVKLLF